MPGADRFSKAFLLLLVALVSLLFFEMTRGFALPLFLAAVFAGMLSPLYRRLLGWFHGRRAAAALVTLLAFFLLVFLPFLGFLGVVAAEAVRVSHAVTPWIEEQIRNPNRLEETLASLPGLDRLTPYHDAIVERLGRVAAGAGNFLVQGVSAGTRGTVSFFFHLFLMLYAMFFFLMDGERILRRILYLMPLPHDAEMRLTDRFVSVTRATLRGTLLIGVIQGGLAGAGLWLAGIPGPAFWSTVMAVLSIIPGIGAGLVWAPAVVWLYLQGETLTASLLLGWCALVVGSVDNLLRPRLVGRDTKMHDLLILLGTLGGIALFGLVGFIVGPVIAALFVTVWDIYGEVFADVLPEVDDLDPPEPPAEGPAGAG